LRRHQLAVVTMGLELPPYADGAAEGLATLEEILAQAPETKVIVLSGNHERANAFKAIALGAYDFHQQPFEPDLLGLVIERAYVLHQMQQENQRMLQIAADSPLAGIITRDTGMLKLCRDIERVAPSSATVMLLGAGPLSRGPVLPP
jgi:DNA-binding NtrC family response regulator